MLLTKHKTTPKFQTRLRELRAEHEKFIGRPNKKVISHDNGIFHRYKNTVLTPHHIPLTWRFDFDPETNPFLMERLEVNSVFNSGAIEFNGQVVLIPRIESNDVKSFFGIAHSENGVDNFSFYDYPIVMPQTDDPDMNVYDIRLIEHEDGWIYGNFCTERKDKNQPNDTSAAIAQCGIARTKDLKTWERLPDLRTHSPQQRNCVLHPEFIDGKYAFYTRPMDGFIDTGGQGGIGWGLCDDIENAIIDKEYIIDLKKYHTITEVKNGLGPAPIKTEKGWLHLAHGVRNTAAGLRYVLYMFLCDLDKPWIVTHHPGRHFLAPQGEERVGDVSNVVFSNGWVLRDSGEVLIYYGSSDTRVHVATSSIEQLLDYVINTPPDAGGTYDCVQQRISLIKKNLSILNEPLNSNP